MWITLFILAVAAAICFGVAAIILQFGSQSRDVIETMHSADGSTTHALLRNLSALAAQNPILLTDRMKSLRLDPDEFARFEPVVFQELSIRCRTCKSATRCASDLARNSSDQIDHEWRDYCPNASTLNVLGILQGCSFDVHG